MSFTFTFSLEDATPGQMVQHAQKLVSDAAIEMNKYYYDDSRYDEKRYVELSSDLFSLWTLLYQSKDIGTYRHYLRELIDFVNDLKK